MKIVLISVVSLICVAGIVLGVVFLNKKPAGNNGGTDIVVPNNPSNPSGGDDNEKGWYDDFSDNVLDSNYRANATAAAERNSFNVFFTMPCAGYVDKNKELYEISSHYFIIKNGEALTFYHFSQGANGKYKVVNLCSATGNGLVDEGATNLRYVDHNEKYVVIEYTLSKVVTVTSETGEGEEEPQTTEETVSYFVYAFIDISGDTATLAYKLDTAEEEIDYAKMHYSSLDFSENNNFVFFYMYENKYFESEGYVPFNTYFFIDLLNGNGYNLGTFKNDELNYIEHLVSNNFVMLVKGNTFLIYSVIGDKLYSDNLLIMDNVSYKLIQLTNEKCMLKLGASSYKEIELQADSLNISNYLFAENVDEVNFLNDNGYSVIREKVRVNDTISYRFSYYEKNTGDLAFTFSSNFDYDKILRKSGNYILFESGLYKFNSAVDYESLLVVDNSNVSLFWETVTSDVFPVASISSSGIDNISIVNMHGEVLFNHVDYSMFDVEFKGLLCDGTNYILVSTEDYYFKINLTNGTLEITESIFLDDPNITNITSNGIYLVKNDDNKYTVKDYSGKVLIENAEYNFIKTLGSGVVVDFKNNEDEHLYINFTNFYINFKNQTVSAQSNKSKNNTIDNYSKNNEIDPYVEVNINYYDSSFIVTHGSGWHLFSASAYVERWGDLSERHTGCGEGSWSNCHWAASSNSYSSDYTHDQKISGGGFIWGGNSGNLYVVFSKNFTLTYYQYDGSNSSLSYSYDWSYSTPYEQKDPRSGWGSSWGSIWDALNNCRTSYLYYNGSSAQYTSITFYVNRSPGTRAGYTFDGWKVGGNDAYYDSDNKMYAYSFTPTRYMSNSWSAIAQWRENKYKLYFECSVGGTFSSTWSNNNALSFNVNTKNYGTGSHSSQYYLGEYGCYSNTFSATNATKVGYKFTKWYVSADGGSYNEYSSLSSFRVSDIHSGKNPDEPIDVVVRAGFNLDTIKTKFRVGYVDGSNLKGFITTGSSYSNISSSASVIATKNASLYLINPSSSPKTYSQYSYYTNGLINDNSNYYYTLATADSTLNDLKAANTKLFTLYSINLRESSVYSDGNICKYSFVGWRVVKTDSINGDKYNIYIPLDSSSSNNTKIISDYFISTVKKTDATYNAGNETIIFEAIYKIRNLTMTFSYKDADGATPFQTGVSNSNDYDDLRTKTMSCSYNFYINNNTTNVSSYNVNVNDSYSVTISLKNEEISNKTYAYDVYNIAKVVIKGLPYISSGSPYTADVTILFNIGSTNEVKQITSSGGQLHNFDGTNYSANSGNMSFYLGDYAYNKVTIQLNKANSSGNKNEVKLTFDKCNLAKLNDGSISVHSVCATGTAGYEIYASATTTYLTKNNDHSSYVESISAIGTTAASGNSTGTSTNRYFVVPVNKESDGNFSFWVNSQRCNVNNVSPSKTYQYTKSNGQVFKYNYYYVQFSLSNMLNATSQTTKLYYIIIEDINDYCVGYIVPDSNTSTDLLQPIPAYGNVSLFVFEPDQAKIYSATTTSNMVLMDASSNNADNNSYELKSYISNITIGSANFSLSVPKKEFVVNDNKANYNNKTINGTGLGYSIFADNYDTNFKNPFSQNGDFYYKGQRYTILGLTYKKNGDYNYKLYYAYNQDNGKYIYFLVGTGNSLGQLPTDASTNVSVTFTSLTKNLDFALNIKDTSDIYRSEDTNTRGLSVLYTKNSTANNTTTGTTFASTDKNIQFNPSDEFCFTFSPLQGYLIESVNIYLGTHNSETSFTSKVDIYHALLDRTQIGVGATIVDGNFSLYGGTQTVGGTTYQQNFIKYNVSNYTPFSSINNSEFAKEVTNVGTANQTRFAGIYLANLYSVSGSNYVANLITNGMRNGTMNFETFSLYISGIYDDIKIEVNTISYTEFVLIPGDDTTLNDLSIVTGLGNAGGSIGNLSIAYYTSDNVSHRFVDPLEIKGLVGAGTLNNSVTNSLKSTYGDNNIDTGLYSSDFSVIVTDGKCRLLFLGFASKLRYGFSIFATGEEFAYSMTRASYYNDPLNKNLFDKLSTNPYIFMRNNESLTTNKYNNDRLSLEILSDSSGTGSKTFMFLSVHDDEYSTSIVKSESLYNFFTKRETTGYYPYTSNCYIRNNKFTLTIELTKRTYTVNSRSKLFVNDNGGANYQDDNPMTKTGTWFNNVTVTNIDYYDDRNDSTVPNWQDVDFKNGVQMQTVSNVYGYFFKIRYYEIPGYYLDKVKFAAYSVIDDTATTRLFGNGKEIFNYVGTTYNSAYNTIAGNYTSSKLSYSSYASGQEKNNFSYHIVYNSSGYYDIYIYNVNNMKNYVNAVSSLSHLACNNFEVDILSKQYKINITYHDNVPNTASSKSSTLTWMKDSSDHDIQTQEITYDRLTPLTAEMSMAGYTFVGWGSQLVNTTNRYDGTKNAWSSASAWKSVVSSNNYFEKKVGFGSKFTANSTTFNSYFDYSDSSALTRTDYYEFYNNHGYFVTDTGFSLYDNSETGYRTSINAIKAIGLVDTQIKDSGENLLYNGSTPERYNFWITHSDAFIASIGNTSGDPHTRYYASLYNFDLYGIWKANTYVVNLDVNEIMTSEASAATTRVSKGGITSFDLDKVAFSNRGTNTFDILPGQTQDSLNYALNTGLQHSGIKYYLYITFDTNEWYVLNSNQAGIFSSYNAVNFKGVTLKEFIIDRFGYSWLGWFTKKFDRVFQVDNSGYFKSDDHPTIQTRKTNYEQTDLYYVYGNKKYRNNGNSQGSASETEFLTFNYTNLINKFADYREIKTVHFAYYGEVSSRLIEKYYHSVDDTDTAITTARALRGETVYYVEKDSSLKTNVSAYTYNPYIYFYDYQLNGSSSSGYYTEDLLNTYNDARYYNNSNNPSIYQKKIFYYDTSLNFNYMTYVNVTDGNPGNVNNRISFDWNNGVPNETFRYVTIYAYWETNLYTVITDYRDNRDSNGGTLANDDVTREVYGTTTAEKPANGKSLLPAYFDDADFETRLKKLLPTRIGYDFMGWALSTTKNEKQFSLVNIQIKDKNVRENGLSSATRFEDNNTPYYEFVARNRTVTFNLYYWDLIITVQDDSKTYTAEYDTANNAFKFMIGSTYYYFNVVIEQTNIYTKKVYIATDKDYYYAIGYTFVKPSGKNPYQLTYGMRNTLYKEAKIGTRYLTLDELLSENNRELLGDNDDFHYIFTFAVWKPQTFSINVSLNIEQNQLKNLYDLDSEFALALYSAAVKENDVNGAGDIVRSNLNSIGESYNYVGIKSSYSKQNTSATYADWTYTDIVANAFFEIQFDTKISTAKITLGTQSFTLDTLYATSAGNYFVNWCLDKALGNILVSNNSNTTYNGSGNLTYNTEESIKSSTLYDRYFNNSLYESLVVAKLNIYNDESSTLVSNRKYSVERNTVYDRASKLLITVNVDIENSESLSDSNKERLYTETHYTDTTGTHTLNSLSRAGYRIDDYTLNSVDYNNGNVSYSPVGTTNFYSTISSSSNRSTNFGYIIKSGKYYSLCVDNNKMYYVNASGDLKTVIPYTIETNGYNQANTTGSKLSFDETAFYYNGYVIKYYDLNKTITENGVLIKNYVQAFNGTNDIYNAYYVDRSYDKTEIRSIKLYFVEVDDSNPNAEFNATINTLNFVLEKTREFTIFADWQQKNDLNISINNKNNSEYGYDYSNKGLAGYYAVTNKSKMYETDPSYSGYALKSSTSQNPDLGDGETGINLNYHFYDNLDLYIAPYYNGRYLSEMTINFYDYEDTSGTTNGSKYATRFSKVTYSLNMKFKWDNSIHYNRLYNWTLSKTVNGLTSDTKNIIPAVLLGTYNISDINASTNYAENTISMSYSNILAPLSIMSIIDQSAFGLDKKIYEVGGTNNDIFNPYPNNTNSNLNAKVNNYFFKFLSYYNNYEYQLDYETQTTAALPVTFDSNGNVISGDGRVDVNPFIMSLYNVMSNVDIDCKFSVQTYTVEFYNVFDPKADQIEIPPDKVADGTYKMPSMNLETLLKKTESAYVSSLESSKYRLNVSSEGDKVKDLSALSRFATITIDSVTNTNKSLQSFDVPYGTYIYGQFYTANSRPIDDVYDSENRTGYNTSIYTGFHYIFDDSIYDYGGTGIKIGDQTYNEQCFPVLGSSSVFSNSFMESSSLYTFVAWLVPERDVDPLNANPEDGNLYFRRYNRNREASSINANLVLVGYYYATNKPTEIKFYTWDNNSKSNVIYGENSNLYTLQSATKNDISGLKDNEVILKVEQPDNVPLAISTQLDFGVDVARFGTGEDQYTITQINNTYDNLNTLQNNLINNYWFYRNFNVNIYIDNNNNGKYDVGDNIIYYKEARDSSEWSDYYYFKNGKTKTYVQLFSENISGDTFTMYSYDLTAKKYVVIGDSENHEGYVYKRYNSFNEMKNELSSSSNFKILRSMKLFVNTETEGKNLYDLAQRYYILRTGTANNFTEKYYPIFKVSDYNYLKEAVHQKPWSASVISNYAKIEKMIERNNAAQYYVEIEGNIYFLCPPGYTSEDNLYSYSYDHNTFTKDISAIGNGTIIDKFSYITWIYDEFYSVEYTQRYDDYGSPYVDRIYTSKYFEGSSMYYYEKANQDDPSDVEKYYRIYKIESYQKNFEELYGKDKSAWSNGASLHYNLIEKMKSVDGEGNITYGARFYVEIGQQIYFLVLTDPNAVAGSGQDMRSMYYYQNVPINGEDNYVFKLDNDKKGATIQNINNYYLVVNSNYYPVEYVKRTDGGGSLYISPNIWVNKSVATAGVTINSHYAYNNYIDCDGERYYFNYEEAKVYKILKSKIVGGVLVETKLELLSPKDLGKGSGLEIPFSVYTSVNTNYSIKLQLKGANWVYKNVNINSLPPPNIGFWYGNDNYRYVGYINLTDNDLAYISSTVDSKTFNYVDVELYDPNSDSTTKVKYRNERIYDVLMNYVKLVYASPSAEIEQIITGVCAKYAANIMGFGDGNQGQILKSLITVGKFFTKQNSNVVEAVEIIIPVSCDIPLGDGSSLHLNASIKYYIEVISDETSVQGTIYAIPIYSKNVIDFTEEAVDYGSTLSVDLSKMYYCYFENEDNMHTHYYNKFDGNNLKFALLSQYQYDCMIASETYTDGLTSLLKETVLYGDELVDAVPRVSEEDSTTSILSFNRDEILRLEDGVYYLVAYYEKDGYNYAIRISDKAIQVSKDGSNIGQFKLVDII